MTAQLEDRPYFLVIESKVLTDKQAQVGSFDYVLEFASDSIFSKKEHTHTLLSQSHLYEPFFIDLIQVNCISPHLFHLKTTQRFLYLVFMLAGECNYSESGGKKISDLPVDTFQMGYLDQGSYEILCYQGKNVGLIVCISPQWIMEVSVDYHNIKEQLRRFANSTSQAEVLCQCKLDRTIKNWLQKIYAFSKNNIGAIDGNLRKYVSYVLEHYNAILGQQKVDIAIEVKEYLNQNFLNKQLSMPLIADHFFTTERTLFNHFRKQYQITI